MKNIVTMQGINPHSKVANNAAEQTYQDARHRRKDQETESQTRGGIQFSRGAYGKNLNVTTL